MAGHANVCGERGACIATIDAGRAPSCCRAVVLAVVVASDGHTAPLRSLHEPLARGRCPPGAFAETPPHDVRSMTKRRRRSKTRSVAP